MEDLTYAEFSKVNRARAAYWHRDGDTWTGADWSNAMCGEAGEAANVVKKLRRIETLVGQGPDDGTQEKLIKDLGYEIADTMTYLDLLANHYGINIEEVLIAKFNYISLRQGVYELFSL